VVELLERVRHLPAVAKVSSVTNQRDELMTCPGGRQLALEDSLRCVLNAALE
jgi:hypothetical protein